ncbi:hypothetical protein [Tsukamurella sp. PLM1]|uniref:hypothetical protein n=1 Tax=Tsukamurella sp. PLM1 TaxID=2929795 RepID=UPI0020BFFB82|nr:hypothetical protein [Tsukamurella sp. PLM1]
MFDHRVRQSGPRRQRPARRPDGDHGPARHHDAAGGTVDHPERDVERAREHH